MRVPKLCVCFFVALVIFSGCSGKETKNAAKKTNAGIVNDEILDLCTIQADTLNPLRTTVRHNAEVLSLLYDSLFVLSNENEAVPDLCTNLTVMENGQKVALTIRENVQFHDGAALKPQDVAATVNFILASDGFYKERLSCVESAHVNGKKIELFLNKETENIARLLDFPILPESFLEASEESAFLMPPSVGSGVYVLEEYRINKSLRLTVNKTHHSGNVPKYETINIHLLPDEKTAIYMLENKELDALSERALGKEVYTPPSFVLSKPYTTERLMFLGLNETYTDGFSKHVQSILYPWVEQETIGRLIEEASLAEETTEYAGENITLLYCLDSFTQTRTAQKILRESEDGGVLVMGDGAEKETYLSRIRNGTYDLFLGEVEFLPNEDEQDFLKFQKANSPAGMTGLFFVNEVLYFHKEVEVDRIETKNPYLSFTEGR